METQEELSKGKAETFICPGCGDKVAENEDLIICDDCFREAVAIRAIRSQLAAGDLTSAGGPRRARIPPLMRRTCLHGEWLHTPCKQCYEATGSEIHRLVCGPDPDGEKGYPLQQQATEEKKYILQPSIGMRCPKCKQPPLLLCPQNMASFAETAFFVCFGCRIIGQVGVGPVDGPTTAEPDVASCRSGRNGVYLQPIGTHDDNPFEPPLDHARATATRKPALELMLGKGKDLTGRLVEYWGAVWQVTGKNYLGHWCVQRYEYRRGEHIKVLSSVCREILPKEHPHYASLLPTIQEQVSEKKECTYGPVHQFLDKMLACDEELYERLLDTPGFAYWFNQLCLLAKAHGAPEGG